MKAVKFLPANEGDQVSYLLSGGDDQCVKLWRLQSQTGDATCVQTVHDHTAPINCIATLKSTTDVQGTTTTLFVTGAADATIKAWIFDGSEIRVLQTIKTLPKYFPMAVAISPLGDDGNTYIIASAGTRDIVQIYTGTLTHGDSASASATIDFSLKATLTGHEGWIRSLDFTPETPNSSADLLLASASQDKYIRLWRVHQGSELPAQAATASDPTVGAYLPGKSPSNKAHRFRTAGGDDYSVTFESLLFNHDDWIYSAKWHINQGNGDGNGDGSQAASPTLQLLSTSADNSLAIWESDPDSGIWVTTARLGEISREKGATTATGSIGGFWTGLWSPSGTTILTLGRTGSWRRWDWGNTRQQQQQQQGLGSGSGPLAWVQNIAVSGHTRPVTGIAWAPNGEYIVSTSADQTTRLHARWQQQKEQDDTNQAVTWHEMARPQIHGYDLNCLDVLSATQFVSGADEKLMRVFNLPRAVARILHDVAGINTGGGNGDDGHDIDMADAANMPVLGLSNKATVETDDDHVQEEVGNGGSGGANPETMVQHRKSAAPPPEKITHPPLEETLSRHTLWPEIEKLYGHGYELSCLAASHNGKLIASACRASSLNHAVIRIFETDRWTELRPPLAVHTLTATRLRFSPRDDRYLLSVGRDRQWAVFERKNKKTTTTTTTTTTATEKEGEVGYTLLQAEPKGHTRMILDAAWAPSLVGQSRVFVTAGRDKNVKVWMIKEEEAEEEGGKIKLAATIADDSPVTAVDILSRPNREGNLVLASGNETGKIRVHTLSVNDNKVSVVSTFTVQPE